MRSRQAIAPLGRQRGVVLAVALIMLVILTLLGVSAMQVTSLDHAIWFHRPFKVDEWLLYDMDSPSASNGRGFNRGNIFNQKGQLVASVCQEALIRKRS